MARKREPTATPPSGNTADDDPTDDVGTASAAAAGSGAGKRPSSAVTNPALAAVYARFYTGSCTDLTKRLRRWRSAGVALPREVAQLIAEYACALLDSVILSKMQQSTLLDAYHRHVTYRMHTADVWPAYPLLAEPPTEPTYRPADVAAWQEREAKLHAIEPNATGWRLVFRATAPLSDPEPAMAYHVPGSSSFREAGIRAHDVFARAVLQPSAALVNAAAAASSTHRAASRRTGVATASAAPGSDGKAGVFSLELPPTADDDKADSKATAAADNTPHPVGWGETLTVVRTSGGSIFASYYPVSWGAPSTEPPPATPAVALPQRHAFANRRAYDVAVRNYGLDPAVRDRPRVLAEHWHARLPYWSVLLHAPAWGAAAAAGGYGTIPPGLERDCRSWAPGIPLVDEAVAYRPEPHPRAPGPTSGGSFSTNLRQWSGHADVLTMSVTAGAMMWPAGGASRYYESASAFTIDTIEVFARPTPTVPQPPPPHTPLGCAPTHPIRLERVSAWARANPNAAKAAVTPTASSNARARQGVCARVTSACVIA